MFSRILIANRGEIACRIIDTAKRMHIETVAVYSDADRHARHVRLADFSEHIGSAPSNQSYLHIDAIINAAKKHGAQAIHPGYGFLSENPELAKACAAADIIFIGPDAESMITMADKCVAKQTMRCADVPVLPDFYSDNQNDDWQKHAENIGYPLLIKAVAGGGGRGMRLVNNAEAFDDALAAAMREAKSYFDDERVFLEKYLVNPRHIEIQVFADNHGQCVYLFERDCSIQRRHQKIIEEAPAPNFPKKLRQKMGETAVRATLAIDYRGAGTLEFLLDADNHFYFMEMNTRLQVEHPVTECITGVDLVQWQLLVASGAPLPLSQDQITLTGHAIETRIYAEDPSKEFMPSVGELAHVHFPDIQSLRVDTGYESGDHISMHYDAMLAKMIVHEKNRAESLSTLYDALTRTEIIGITTNIPMLAAIVNSKPFQHEALSTHFLPEHPELQTPKKPEPTVEEILVASFAIQQYQHETAQRELAFGNDSFSPWASSKSWRMNLPANEALTIWLDNQDHTVMINESTFHYQNQDYALTGNLLDHECHVTLNQQQLDARVIFHQQQCHLFHDQRYLIFHYGHSSSQESHTNEVAGHITAPMPGTVVEVFVENGHSVTAGDRLLILEAMKMEHTMVAHNDGLVEKLAVKAGDGVNEGMELLTITP